ncbi:MAG: FG-GAP-like repeat-containing protein, partial [Pirellulales bacterium]
MHALAYRSRSVTVALLAVFSLSQGAMAQETAWTFDAPIGCIDSSPAIADVDGDGAMDVVVTTTAGSIIALDGEGRQIWMRGTQIPISIAPTVVDLLGDGRPEVLALNQAGQLFCLDSLAGDPIWKWNLPGKVEWGMTAIVARDIDRDGVAEIVVADDHGTVACLSNDGQVRWTYQGAHGAAYCPAVGNVSGDAADEIVIAGTKRPLVCLSHTG